MKKNLEREKKRRKITEAGRPQEGPGCSWMGGGAESRPVSLGWEDEVNGE